jgi:hypothetical protein
VPSGSQKLAIADPNHVVETFITSVVDVALISGSTVAVTLGTRRYVRSEYNADPQETVCINSRLVLTLDAARNLVNAIEHMLSRAQVGATGMQASETGRLPS